MSRESILRNLAERIASAEFLPFIGAGCSRAMLGGYDWAGITAATAAELGIPTSKDGPGIAQQYQDRFGRDSLAQFLHERLNISAFEDSKGLAQIALMELRFPIYYTTNVDNVTEACYEKYGERIHTIVNLEDLRSVTMGVPMLLKFHGSTGSADSLVWSQTDYDRRRGALSHFMHIRLRSDLLTHSLLFIGYSLSPDDAHVRNLLQEMQTQYGEAMRDSILIAYGPGNCDLSAFDVRIVSTAELYPDLDHTAAFDQFLVDLGAEVTKCTAGRSVQTIFTPAAQEPQKVLSEYQLSSVEKACANQSVMDAAKAFRASIDLRVIPIGLEERVTTLYCSLCERASDTEEARALEFAVAHLRLRAKASYFKIYAAMVAMHWLGGTSFLQITHLPDSGLTRAAIIAGAADLLKQRNIPRNKAFADWIAYNSNFGKEIFNETGVTEDIKAYIVHWFADIFNGSPRTNPLSREHHSTLPTMTYQDILSDMMNSLPRKPSRPF